MDIHYCYHMFIIYRSTECVPEHSFKLQLVLSLVMYIQGLSVIHFFGKAKGLPNAVTILLLIIGTILTPTTHIVGLLGVIDLSLNLKRIMKNNSKK